MIFRNMEALGIDDVHKVLKVGDTRWDCLKRNTRRFHRKSRKQSAKRQKKNSMRPEPTWCSGLCRTWQRPCKDWKGRARI